MSGGRCFEDSKAMNDKILPRMQAEKKVLMDALVIATCEKLYWSLRGSPEEKSTPIKYAAEARKQLREQFKDYQGVEF